MFRGVIQIGLTNRVSSMAALIWQAVAFALFLVIRCSSCRPCCRLALGYLRLRSESLWPPIVAHASLNATLLALTPILPRLTARYLKMASQTTRSILFCFPDRHTGSGGSPSSAAVSDCQSAAGRPHRGTGSCLVQPGLEIRVGNGDTCCYNDCSLFAIRFLTGHLFNIKLAMRPGSGHRKSQAGGTLPMSAGRTNGQSLIQASAVSE